MRTTGSARAPPHCGRRGSLFLDRRRVPGPARRSRLGRVLLGDRAPDSYDISEVDVDAAADPNWKVALFVLGGIVLLPIGAKLLVDGSKSIALELGMSEAAVGLTIVAIGTSLPELATTVMAAIRRQTDVAVGNVVGSNLFNILAVMGGSALFGPLPTPAGFFDLDFWIMLAASLALAPFVFMKRTMTRGVGVIFLLAYLAYIVLALGPRM